MLSISDITERKQAEDLNRLNRLRAESLVEMSGMTESSEDELTAFAVEKAIKLTQGYFEKFKFGYRVGFSLSGKEQKMVHMGSYSAVFCDAARE